MNQYEAYIKATQKNFIYVTIFVTDWAQKTSLTKLVLKNSVLKQSLPNFAGTTDNGEWAQLDLQSIQHRD